MAWCRWDAVGYLPVHRGCSIRCPPRPRAHVPTWLPKNLMLLQLMLEQNSMCAGGACGVCRGLYTGRLTHGRDKEQGAEGAAPPLWRVVVRDEGLDAGDDQGQPHPVDSAPHHGLLTPQGSSTVLRRRGQCDVAGPG